MHRGIETEVQRKEKSGEGMTMTDAQYRTREKWATYRWRMYSRLLMKNPRYDIRDKNMMWFIAGLTVEQRKRAEGV
jgi:hypothetical protein